MLLISNIRDFFSFLYNTKSIDLSVCGSASEYKDIVKFYYPNFNNDPIFNGIILNKFSSQFENWAQAISSYISLKSDVSHIQLSSSYRDTPITLFPKLLVFDTLSREALSQSDYPVFASLKTAAKDHIRQLKVHALDSDTCFYDAMCVELGKLSYIPKLQERLLTSLSDNSYWLDTQLLRINSSYALSKPLTPTTIAETCYNLRLAYAHDGKAVITNISELLSLHVLEEVIYCIILDRINASRSVREEFLQVIFRL